MQQFYWTLLIIRGMIFDKLRRFRGQLTTIGR